MQISFAHTYTPNTKYGLKKAEKTEFKKEKTNAIIQPKKNKNLTLNHYRANSVPFLNSFTGSYKKDKHGKQILNNDIYFVYMSTYGKNTKWADDMIQATYELSEMMEENCDFDSILEIAEEEIAKINGGMSFGKRKSMFEKKLYNHYTVLKEFSRGFEYWDKYFNLFNFNCYSAFPKIKNISNEKYKGANVCKISYRDDYIDIEYGQGERSNLEFVKQEYEKLKATKNPTEEQILESCAIIQWLFSQETPYLKGSNSIATLLTKAIMHSNKIMISPLKEGISLDFEAFYRSLDDYIKIYPDLYRKPCRFLSKYSGDD